MARELYLSIGGIVATTTVDDGDLAAAAATFDVYDAFTGGSQVTDLLTPAGSAATQVVVPTETIPAFQAPDGTTDSLFLEDAANPGSQRIPAYPTTIATRAGTGTGAVTSVAGDTGDVVLIATDITDSTSTGRSVLTAASTDAAQTAIGATTTGKTFVVAASTTAAQTALGATTTGKAVIVAADAAAAQTAIGATVTGKAAITAATADALATAAGGTTTGKAVLTAASSAAALSAIGGAASSDVDGKVDLVDATASFRLFGMYDALPSAGTLIAAGIQDKDIVIVRGTS